MHTGFEVAAKIFTAVEGLRAVLAAKGFLARPRGFMRIS